MSDGEKSGHGADYNNLDGKYEMQKDQLIHNSQWGNNWLFPGLVRQVGSFLQDPISVSGFYTTNIGKISCQVLSSWQAMNYLKVNRRHNQDDHNAPRSDARGNAVDSCRMEQLAYVFRRRELLCVMVTITNLECNYLVLYLHRVSTIVYI